MKNFKKNMFGYVHHFLPGVVVVVIIAFVGVRVLDTTHAQELANSHAAVIKLPTHLMDGQWGFGTNNTLTSISSDMSPKYDPSPDGYFFATEFYWENGKKTGYMGLQTESTPKAGQIIPKTASATIYGGTDSTAPPPPTMLASSNILAQCGNPSGEGYNCSLTAPYNWTPKHTYRFKISLSKANDGSGNSVWVFSVDDITAGYNTLLGTIKAPASWGELDPIIVDFHERFSGPTNKCSNIKPSSVVFTKASGNDGRYPGKVYKIIGNGSTGCHGALKNGISNNTFHSSFLVPSK